MPINTPQQHGLADVLKRNVRALAESRQEFERSKRRQDRVADRITRFTGSLLFVYLQLAFFVSWFIINLEWVPGVSAFDPFPFGMLAMIASVEAIFLSTLVLISQNRSAQLADKRAELDVQIGLLSEHEITRLIVLVDAIAQRLEVSVGRGHELDELKRDVQPQAVLQEIEHAEANPI